MCVPSFFFYMGFWNFIAGSVLLLFTAGYVLRQTARWTGRSLAALTVLACLLYGTHAVPWAVGVVAVAVLCLSDLALVYAMRRAGTPLADRCGPAQLRGSLCAAPGRSGAGGGVVAALESCLADAGMRARHRPAGRPRPLYSLSFLHSLTVADIPLLKMLGAAVLLSAAASRAWRWCAAATSGAARACCC